MDPQKETLMSGREGHIFSRLSNEKLAETIRGYEAAQHDLAAKTNEDRTYWHHFALAELLNECCERLCREK